MKLLNWKEWLSHILPCSQTPNYRWSTTQTGLLEVDLKTDWSLIANKSSYDYSNEKGFCMPPN